MATEIISDLKEMLSNTLDGKNNAENIFAPENGTYRSNPRFSGVMKHFFQKLTKKSHFGSKSNYLVRS